MSQADHHQQPSPTPDMDSKKKPTLADRAKHLAKEGAEKGSEAGTDAAIDSQLTPEEQEELKDKSNAEKAAFVAEKKGGEGLDYLREQNPEQAEQLQNFWNTYCGCLASKSS